MILYSHKHAVKVIILYSMLYSIHYMCVIAYGIPRGRACLSLEEVSRPVRPHDNPYAITFWGVAQRKKTRHVDTDSQGGWHRHKSSTLLSSPWRPSTLLEDVTHTSPQVTKRQALANMKLPSPFNLCNCLHFLTSCHCLHLLTSLSLCRILYA